MGLAVNLNETKFGYELRTAQITILLGGIEAQTDRLREAYPEFTFTRLKQIHSDAVVCTTSKSEDYQVIADSHFTHEKNLALCVITADCVPVFFFDPVSGLVAGAHAGWRGVASKIIPKTVHSLVAQGSKIHDIQVFIGPHIQKSSFEVGNDVRDQILTSLGPLSPAERLLYAENLSEGKARVDLHQVVKTQLQQENILADNVFSLHIDTVTDPRFHSYRRDKEKSGRQVSFICRTS